MGDAVTERDYRLAFEQAPAGMALVTPEGLIRRVNGALCEMLQFGEEELVGRRLEVAVAGRVALDGVSDALARMRAGKASEAQVEVTFRHRSEAVTLLVTAASVVEEERAAPILFAIVVEDVTRRKRVRDEIALLQTVTQAVAEAVGFDEAIDTAAQRVREFGRWEYAETWLVQSAWRLGDLPGTEGMLLSCRPAANPRADDLAALAAARAGATLRPGEGLAGRVYARRLAEWTTGPDAIARAYGDAAKPIADAEIATALAVPIVSHGEVILVLVLMSREAREADERQIEIIGAVGTHLGSLVRRKMAEDASRKAEERFRMVARATNDAVWDWDVARGEVAWNDAAPRLFGYAERDLATFDARLSRVHPADRDRVAASIDAAMASGADLWSGEYRFRRASGAYADILDRGYVIRDDVGRPIRVIGSMLDITDRKQAEQRNAVLLAELATKNQELGDFAHVVSHDLKAPLRAISSLATWLEKDFGADLGDKGREYVHLLTGRVQRMHALIEGILRYSRIGRRAEERLEVDLTEIVADAVHAIAPPPTIDVRVEGRLPVVRVGRTSLTQVFQNLIGNAVHFMDKPRGTIRVACVEGDDAWTLSVKDDGPGIDPKHFGKIFQIFQTLQPRDTFESTGVGLAIVKKSIELHGGRVWVESAPGAGATFFFTLPKAGPRDAADEETT